MAKQLHEIIQPFSSMSYEEKLAVIRRVRYNKYVAKPAVQVKKKKAAANKKKVSNKKIADAMKGVSAEELAKILGELM